MILTATLPPTSVSWGPASPACLPRSSWRDRGYRVVVLEAQRIAWGASGRNGGQVGSAYPTSMAWLGRWVGQDDTRRLFALAEEAKALIRARVDRHGIDCDLKPGNFQAATKPRHMEEIKATRGALE